MIGTIYIIIVVYKRLELTRKCLDSLSNQSYPNYKVIVVDHCTTDSSTFDWIKETYPEWVVIKGDDSMWWTGATNFGIQYVTENYEIHWEADFILSLNNDLTVESNYLKSLTEVYQHHQPCMVGSISLYADDLERIDFAGCKWNKVSTRIRSAIDLNTKYSSIKELGTIGTDLIPGRGALYPIKAIKEIGLYDEQTFPHYASDYDFSYRMFKKGYQLLISTKSIVRSEIGETGLRFDKSSTVVPSIKMLLETQRSIRSPMNVKTRYRWAMKHTRFPLPYFMMDSARVLLAFFRYSINYYSKR